VTALFSSNQLVPRRRSLGRDRRRRRSIPTGAPRLVESSADRQDRAIAESWTSFVDVIRQASLARLELLRGRDGGDVTGCPWSRLVVCDDACRCGGTGTVTVAFLRDHYEHLAAEVAKIARRPS
jgi:hypothetical protein